MPRIPPRMAWATLAIVLCVGSYGAGNAVAWREQSLRLQGFAERDFHYNDCMANQKAAVMADRSRAPGYPSTGYRNMLALLLTEQNCLERSGYSFVSESDLADVSGVTFHPDLPPPNAAAWRHPRRMTNRMFWSSGIHQPWRTLDAAERAR